MARRLQKRLESLESDLTKLFNEDPMENEAAARYHQRFIFLKNLLSAEKESRSSDPDHLHQIEQWLALLETAFLDWVSSPSSSPHHLHTCSCTHKCLNEQDGPSETASQVDDSVEDADPEPVSGQESEDPEQVSGDQDVEERAPTTPPLVVFSAGGVRRSTGKGRIWAVIAVTMFAVAVGMVAAGFSRRSLYYQQDYFILPPT